MLTNIALSCNDAKMLLKDGYEETTTEQCLPKFDPFVNANI